MIDFNKRLQQEQSGKPTDPIMLYETLDRLVDKGPLRASQEAILKEWYSDRKDERDLIVKLHTGQGKTLIGLLMLMSRLNSNTDPVVYVCPNIYLAEQTRKQAKQFGIKTCEFDSSNNFPDEFWDNSSILVTYVQKLFNGLTKFGLRNQSLKVGTIVLDDSHACIDSIEAATTLTIPKESDLYNDILVIFKDSLELQGYAKFHEIKSGESNEVMLVPYWSWNDHYEQVVQKIIAYKNEKYVLFIWPIIRDVILSCNCYISSSSIEIKPYLSPVDLFGSFSRASHRIMMSATTNNDAFFVKSLGISPDTIKNPLVYSKEKWSGEKLILIPYQIDEKLNRTEIVNWLATEVDSRRFGVVAITPSFSDAVFWENCGAVVAYKSDLNDRIDDLKNGIRSKTVVFANRYDGIDLSDDSCRILIIDNKPYGQTLEDKYFEDVRSDSQLINIKVAQKIEQGLGRGVRGEKDYCFILLTGRQLVSAVKNPRFKKFFSSQTQQQIDVGVEVTRYAVEDANKKDSKKIVIDAMNQMLSRDEGWKKFYRFKMNEIDDKERDDTLLDILEIERNAELAYLQGNYPKAKDYIFNIISQYYCDDLLEKGYYQQEMARMTYPMSKVDSNKLQISAHRDNRSLLRPKDGMIFKKLSVEGKRIERIKDFINQFEDYSGLKAKLELTLGGLNFNPNSKKFELALEAIGKNIGFTSERPEEAWKEGPDNLWGVRKGEYFLFECKSGTKETRAEIHQNEAEQLLNSTRWFEEKYVDCEVLPIIVINPRLLAKGAFLPENGQILNIGGLAKLKARVRSFFKEFSNVDIKQVPDITIQEWLKSHELEVNNLKQLFKEPVYPK
ncbi:MAG TPA: DEAD/DEAH box helicase family protein [Saprospiraceae bacterium]|nr:DEAD/DEAH box helicase family protein [Saprospiraceae bacterium]